ncbi:MAG: CoA transferase [Dehalococcoidia bacterium]|nr:CoA transferase [Dehalococcoidia bacterium]
MASPGPLDGLRVVDWSTTAAASMCSRLLADFGAGVTFIAPADGHPLDSLGPRLPGGRSAIATYLFANKSFVTLDPDSDVGREQLLALARSADVVVSDLPPSLLASRGLEYATLASPRLVMAHVTPHGMFGPLAEVRGNDLTTAARSGWASINGLASRPPLKPSGWNSSYCAGASAYAAIVAALISRNRDAGYGQEIDIAATDVMASTFAPGLLRVQYTGQPFLRPSHADMTTGPVPVADGHFALTISRAHFWREAMNLLDLPDLAEDRRWDESWFRQKHKDLYIDRVQERMATWNRMDLFDELAVRRVIAGPVLTVEELTSNEHLHGRGFWVQHPGEPSRIFPGAPYRMSRTPWSLRNVQPEPTELPSAALPPPVIPATGSRTAPLAGLRGIVLTQAWAGTYCTELLAFLGADVIQVEVRKRLDSWRGSFDTPMPAALADVTTAEHSWNCNALYNSVNLNKRCITLDLQDPAGLETFKQLIPHADFVAENFSPRVLGNFGLEYAEMQKLNPRVVVCSLSAYGHTGPWSNVPGIGGTIEPTSGMSSLLGYSDGPPMNSGQMYPDAVAGTLAAGAIAAAIYERNRSGEGQYIDLSMQEANLTFLGDAVVEYMETGQMRARMGNRHPAFAPHGMYESSEGSWLAFACESEADWLSLCRLVPDLDSSLDQPARKAQEDAIDAAVAHWVSSRTRNDALAALLGAGLPAAPVLDAADLASDENLRRRNVVVDVTHPEAGTWAQVASPFHFSVSASPAITAAPRLGAHGFEVLHDLVAMTREQYDDLVRRNISGEGPPS